MTGNRSPIRRTGIADGLELDGMIQPGDSGFIARDEIESPDNVGASFKLDKDGTSLKLVAGLKLGSGASAATVLVPVSLSEEDTERLYQLAYKAVVEQLRNAEPDTAIPARLPQVITSYDLPKPLSDPLVSVENGRKRVLDDRESPNNFNGRRRYIASRLVHRADCKKHGRKTYNDKAHKGGDWPDMYDAISKGLLIVELCTICKPLGEHTKTVNARLAWSTFSTAPEGMPDHVHGFNPNPHADHLHRHQVYNDSVLGDLTFMTPQRWQAHAEFIRWCVEQEHGPVRDAEQAHETHDGHAH